MAEWYHESFGEDYLLVYKHRDMQGAAAEAAKMIDWLQLPAGAEVFDLCCGMGRHSLALADRGFRMTGMDLSGVLLAEAKRLDEGGRVRWLQGDMRSIPASGPFDAVVNLFTSFGYFEDDADSRLVVDGIERILKDGGRFLIDFLNASYVKRCLVPVSERNEGALRIVEKRRIEDGFVRKQIVISEAGGPDRHYMEQVKLYGLDDFNRLLEGTRLRIDAVYGGYDGSAYAESASQRLILIGTKLGGERTHG